jgi:type IV secretion system protein VirD4
MGFFAEIHPAQGEATQGGDLIAFDGDSHALTFAPTGAGKGVSCVIPNAIMHEGALIVLDLAGDIYHATAQRRRDMGQKVYRLNLADEGGTDSLNPLDLAALCGQDTAAVARSLASELVERSASSMESRFWDDWGETMLTGGIAWLLDDVPPEHRHIAHLFDLFTGNDPVYSIATALDSKTVNNPAAYKAFASFLQLPERDTRPSVLAVIQAHLRLFDSALVRKVTSTTSIDLDGLVRGDAVSLYITVPPARLEAFRPILRSWISGLMFAFMQRKAEPKHRTLVLCDEMGNLGRINALVTSFTLVRKAGVTLWGFLQNPAQLDIYGSQARTILDNAGVIQVFGARNRRMAADFAGLVGCDVEAVAALAKDEQLLLVDGGRPLKARRLRYYADKEFAGLYRDREPAMSR